MSNENDYVISTHYVKFRTHIVKNAFLKKFRDTSDTSLGIGLLKKQEGFIKCDIFNVIYPAPHPAQGDNLELEISTKWQSIKHYEDFQEVYKQLDDKYTMWTVHSLARGKHNFHYPLCLCNVDREYESNGVTYNFKAHDLLGVNQYLLQHHSPKTTEEELTDILRNYILSSDPEQLKLKCYNNYLEIDGNGNSKNLNDIETTLKSPNLTIHSTEVISTPKITYSSDNACIVYVYRRKYNLLGSPKDYYYVATTQFKYEEINNYSSWRALLTQISHHQTSPPVIA